MTTTPLVVGFLFLAILILAVCCPPPTLGVSYSYDDESDCIIYIYHHKDTRKPVLVHLCWSCNISDYIPMLRAYLYSLYYSSIFK